MRRPQPSLIVASAFALVLSVCALLIVSVGLEPAQDEGDSLTPGDSVSDRQGLVTVDTESGAKAPTAEMVSDTGFEAEGAEARALHFLGGRQSTVWPEAPLDVYRSNIARAEAGDADAMYWVSKSLRTCSGLLRDDFAHEQYLLAHPALADYADEYEIARDHCRPLWNELPGEDYSSRASEWLARSAEGGHKTAQVELALTSPQAELDLESIEALLLKAVQEDGYPAYYWTRSYLIRRDGAGPASTAWEILWCEESPACSPGDYTEALEYEYLPWQLEEIRSNAREIRSKIASRSLTGLGD